MGGTDSFYFPSGIITYAYVRRAVLSRTCIRTLYLLRESAGCDRHPS